MKTKDFFLNVLIALSVFTAFLLIACILVDGEKQEYEQLISK